MPKISLAIPTHEMANKDFFLQRCLQSIHEQTYQNYEIIITKKGRMAENTNEAIRRSKGDLIKILYMDDFLAHKNALQLIVDSFTGNWLATGCIHDNGRDEELFNPHYPSYNNQIQYGNNTIGSPSVVTIRKGLNIWFDENMTWLLDCAFYKDLYETHGPPVLLNNINVVLGVGDHQMTHILTDTEKLQEFNYVKNKYEN